MESFQNLSWKKPGQQHAYIYSPNLHLFIIIYSCSHWKYDADGSVFIQWGMKKKATHIVTFHKIAAHILTRARQYRELFTGIISHRFSRFYRRTALFSSYCFLITVTDTFYFCSCYRRVASGSQTIDSEEECIRYVCISIVQSVFLPRSIFLPAFCWGYSIVESVHYLQCPRLNRPTGDRGIVRACKFAHARCPQFDWRPVISWMRLPSCCFFFGQTAKFPGSFLTAVVWVFDRKQKWKSNKAPPNDRERSLWLRNTNSAKIFQR